MTVVNVNPLYTARELEHQLNDSGATAIIVLENFAHTLQSVLARTPVKTVITTQVGDLLPGVKGLLTNFVVKHVKKMVPQWSIPASVTFMSALRAGRAHVLDDVPLTHDDIAFLQYTGGTTGVAKGAVLTHGNMVANLQQVHAWIARDLHDGVERAILPLPLYHVYALTSNLVFMKIGAHVILITNPRDVPGFVKELAKHPFTVIIGVNTLYNALLNAPGFKDVATRQNQDGQCRRHGGAARGGRTMEAGDRCSVGRELRAHGDVAGGDLQHARHRGLDRQHRRAHSLDRSRDPG